MALIIWRFTDRKPGHDSQSIGLCDAIGRLTNVTLFDFEAGSTLSCICSLILNRFPAGKGLPNPDLIIGAGHGTHFSMLAARKARYGKTIVLMKPSLPLSLFDYCIIPEHDCISEKNNVITTAGSLNPITFNENKSSDSGLILLGGLSKHYQWDNESIIKQIISILDDKPDLKWAIADSPRTPESTLLNIGNHIGKSVELLKHSETKTTDIREYINNANTIWITQDSISMIYESLSSGASVGLIELNNKSSHKVEKTIQSLIDKSILSSFSMWDKSRTLPPGTSDFNEANRCAKILSDKGIFT